MTPSDYQAVAFALIGGAGLAGVLWVHVLEHHAGLQPDDLDWPSFPTKAWPLRVLGRATWRQR